MPGGSTALLDAIYLGANQMRHACHSRHALVIISDGGENNSRYHLREINEMIRESDIQVDAIGLFDTALFKTYEEYMGKKWLGEITDATGGHTLPIENLSMLPQAAAEISWALRNHYVLGYKPADTTARAGRRRIKVLHVAIEGPFSPAILPAGIFGPLKKPRFPALDWGRLSVVLAAGLRSGAFW
jgi:Ca-activated chloride channel homolog